MAERDEILIVDDLPDHITYASKLLKAEGYRVYSAGSGKQALNFLKKKQPDLILLDIKIPDMSGLVVCKNIKENPKTCDIPVVFLTSENRPEVIHRGFEIGCCDYILKPFIQEECIARVHMHIRMAKQKKELAAANRELNMFCSAVSHDLRSPLEVISLLINTLKAELEGQASEEVIQVANMIQDKSDQLRKMIVRLLEFSKMCNIVPDFQEIDLDSIFDSVFDELKSLEPERCITFIHGTLGKVIGDEVLIRLAIKNVLHNSIKFTSKRENAIITVSAEQDEIYTNIVIKDNGVGFDMEYADKLLMIFQRLHEENEYEGSGVGLALVDRIMKRHGGEIIITGVVNQGAEVTLRFVR